MTGYDLFYLAASPVLAGHIAWRRMTQGKYRESGPAMLGRHLDTEDPAMWENGCVLVHAVSVGEVIAAKSMLPLLRRHFDNLPILLTTVTETGQAQARSLGAGLADAVRYFPLDLSWIVRKFARVYRPRVVILMETELWPNVLSIVPEQGAKIFVMNGRIGENSFRMYRRVRRLLSKPLGNVTAFCMQSDADAARVRKLRDNSADVYVTGNCKFDAEFPILNESECDSLRREMGVGASAKVIVVGSTHAGEEEIAMRAMSECISSVPDAIMLVAPRHPERFSAVWQSMVASGLSVRRISTGEVHGEGPLRFLLVDQMGILSRLYGIADVAVVAGSLVPGIGGHNLLEAAAHGVPVVYGPHTDKQRDMVRVLEEAEAGTVASDDNLGKHLLQLLVDNDLGAAKGRAGQAAVQRNRGAAQRNMDVLIRHMEETK